jgi:hypothetical protein
MLDTSPVMIEDAPSENLNMPFAHLGLIVYASPTRSPKGCVGASLPSAAFWLFFSHGCSATAFARAMESSSPAHARRTHPHSHTHKEHQ